MVLQAGVVRLLVRLQYIDLARAKSEALVNNTCNKKKSNRVTLNGGRQ